MNDELFLNLEQNDVILDVWNLALTFFCARKRKKSPSRNELAISVGGAENSSFTC
jgi:hypothetical protein